MASDSQAGLPVFLELAAHPLRWGLLTALARGDLRVRELVAELDQPQNLVSYHLGLLRRGGLVTTRRSTYDGRDTYYHLDLDRCADGLALVGARLHPVLRPDSSGARRRGRPAVLFLCTGNSARSPIAEALLRDRSDGRVRVVSAGSQPKPEFHPNAFRVLHEAYDLRLPDGAPRHVDKVAHQRFDYVISLCDKVREVCPSFSSRPELVHWSIPDPAATGRSDRASYPAFRTIADELDNRIRQLLPVLRIAAQP